ncbi:hypothetical protein Taro_020808 [Colocasia esculenta]|uniref:Uncharacterized protein n=1 Tax=Colocasia esculenta TaxID=4460 RepID=A0A843V0N7_COLES|nr:hypothetical protein [Colocasia esculenta]
MHSTSCYLFTYTCASDRLGFDRVMWSFLAEIGPRGPVGVSGGCTKPQTGESGQRSRSRTGSAGAKGSSLVDVAGETTSLRALLHSAMQDREAAQREAEQLLERVRRAAAAGASSSRAVEGPQSDLEDRLAAVVRRAEETQADLAERRYGPPLTELQGQVDSVTGERDQLGIRAEVAKARVAEATRELATLRVQGSLVDQEELARLCTDLQAQQTLVRGLQEVMTAIGRSRSRSRSGVSGASGATDASVRQYLVGSSSRWRNEEEGRCHRGEVSAQSSRGGGEMPPPPDRQEGSGESGGGQ